MIRVIPIEIGNVNQSLEVQLDGVSFVIRVFWQDRDESWYFELMDASESPIWMGQRIATGVPLLRQCRNPRRPAGELIVIDTLGQDKDPGLDDFGGNPARIKMGYIEASDLVAAGLTA